MRGTRWFRLPEPKSGYAFLALLSHGMTASEYEVLMTTASAAALSQASMTFFVNRMDSGLQIP